MPSDETLAVGHVQLRLRDFTARREWERFHSPKNLSMALAAEAGELLELFQWLTEEETKHLSDEDRGRVEQEIADIQIYLLRLVDVLGISLSTAVEAKLALNEGRYPVEESRGNATKYSRREPQR
jgi:dCTP diphosphatase